MTLRFDRRRVRFVCLAVFGYAYSWTAVPAQAPAARRESTAVEVSPAATRQLANALELAQQQNWPRLLDLLDDLTTRTPSAMVEVESRRVVRAGLIAHVLRSQLPVEALTTHRSRVDLQTAAWVEQARITGDVRLLRRVWEVAPASTVAGEAMHLWAEELWRQDQLDAAAAVGRLLDPTAIDTEFSPLAPLRIAADGLSTADLAGRRVLIEIMSRDFSRAAELLQQLEIDHADAVGTIAGDSGRLAPLLAEVLDRERSFAASGAGGASEARPSTANAAIPISVGAPLWNLPYAESSSVRQLSNRPSLWAASPPEQIPVVAQDRLFWNDDRRVYALRNDGRPLWPAGDGTAGASIFETDREAMALELGAIGESLRQVAVAEGRLIALLGPGIAVEAEREPRAIESELVCLDVGSGEGKLLWSVAPHEVLPDAHWRFSGLPLLRGELVMVPARRSRPGMALGVAGLEARTGHFRWFTNVAGLLQAPPATHHLRTADQCLEELGRGYLVSAGGCTAAFDLETGAADWIRRDDPQPWKTSTLIPSGETAGRRGVLHRGRLFTLQQDDQTIQCLDGWTGALVWRQLVPTRVARIDGIRCGVLAVTGAQAWGLDVDTGEVRWRTGVDDVEGEFVGSGLLAGESLWTCTADELWEIGLRSGALHCRVPLWEAYGIRGGHLAAGSQEVYIASHAALAALRAHRRTAPVR